VKVVMKVRDDELTCVCDEIRVADRSIGWLSGQLSVPHKCQKDLRHHKISKQTMMWWVHVIRKTSLANKLFTAREYTEWAKM